MVRLEFVRIAEWPPTREFLLMLREHGGVRRLPVSVGACEAMAVSRAARGGAPPRPGPHDLLAAVIGRLGGALEAVVIHDLKGDTFYALLEVRSERGLIEVDCRTSDAVVLALRAGRPIFATEDVLRRAAVSGTSHLPSAGAGADGPRGAAPA